MIEGFQRTEYQEFEGRRTGCKWIKRLRSEMNKNDNPEDTSPLNFITEWIFHFKIMKVRNPLPTCINRIDTWVAVATIDIYSFQDHYCPRYTFSCLAKFSKRNQLKENNCHLFLSSGHHLRERDSRRSPSSHLKK